jgi:hypothetical protein
MAEFKIDRLRYTWVGPWTTGTTYAKDSVVSGNGKSYVCLIPHIAGNFNTDLNSGNWTLMTTGTTWLGLWQANTTYSPGNIVIFGGSAYICIIGYTSGLTFNNFYWSLYGQFEQWQSTWATSTSYGPGSIVKYGGMIYLCITQHTSASTVSAGLEVNLSAWTVLDSGINYLGTWTASTRYKLNDVVKYGPDLWVNSTGHTSGTTFNSSGYWSIWLPGIEFGGTWSNVTAYQPGDVVTYGGYSYVSVTQNNTGNIPSIDAVDWTVFTQGYSVQGEWNNSTTYKIGSVVRRYGWTYIATADNTNQNPAAVTLATTVNTSGSSGTTLIVNSTTSVLPGMIISGNGFTRAQTVVSITGGTTLIINEPPDGTLINGESINFLGINYAYWKLHAPGVLWNNKWAVGTSYHLGDVVNWKNRTYRCILDHTAVTSPDLDASFTNWVYYLFNDTRNALNAFGDMVTFNNGSTTAIPIGTTGTVLKTVSSYPTWSTLHITPNVFYVSTNGSDTNAGTTWDTAWRTVAYACQQVAKGTMNPNASFLLASNKEFIVQESYNWQKYQIANSVSPFSSTQIAPDAVKTQRDLRYVVDAFIYDITRGGNSQTVAATLAYFDLEYSNKFITPAVAAEITYFIATLNYSFSLILNVLANTAPSANYQILEGVASSSQIAQVINLTYTTESGVTTTLANLENILITALTNQSTLSVPPANSGITTTINVKSGTYQEILPITVPENTALVGDELRGTVITPTNIVNTLATSSTAGGYNLFTVGSTVNMSNGTPVQFVSQNPVGSIIDTTFGGITAGQTYYVIGNSITPSQFQVSASNGTYSNLATTVVSSAAGSGAIFNATRNQRTYNLSLVSAGSGYVLGDIISIPGTSLGAKSPSNTITITVTGTSATYGPLGQNASNGVGSGASFTVTTSGLTYSNVVINANGGGYAVNDTVTINGGNLGGASGAIFIGFIVDNVLTVTILSTGGPLAVNDIILSGSSTILPNTSITAINSAGWNGFINGTTLTITSVTSGTPSVGMLCQGGVTSAGTYITNINTASFAGTITLGTPTTFQGQISGTTLSVSSVPTGTGITLGMVISGGSITSTTLYVVANLSGTATSLVSTWQLSESVTQSLTTLSGTQVILTASQTTGTIGVNQVVSGSGVTAPTYIVRLGSGSGSDGTYLVIPYQSATTTSMSTLSYTVNNNQTFGAYNLTTTFTGLSYSVTNSQTVDSAATPGAYYTVANDLTITVTSTNGIAGGITGVTWAGVTPGNGAISSFTKTGSSVVTLTTNRGYMYVYGGGALSDMFRVRNGTGLRNMTFSGLLGTLSAANSYGTRRPTGGTYVALDPGTGPNDTSAWIFRKSPYVQNVTTFGLGSVGMKINADLHNGGNKSMVCNDYTQIMSDGIGIWLYGGGALCEAVSVFCYYTYAGYFSENGGRMRATNGNSSYGDYGVIAEGYDNSEVPISASVNNRSQQAVASAVSSFGSSAQILKIQFTNAGNNYINQTANLLKYTNNFLNGAWQTDGNITLLQNVIAPTGITEGWQVTGITGITDSSYIYQTITIPQTGAIYTGLSGTNVQGSGTGATFNVAVAPTGYTVTVNAGGSGYVINNNITIPGNLVGGQTGLNDITLTIASIQSPSSILTVTASGNVPNGTTQYYTCSLYVLAGTSTAIDLYATFSGSSSMSSAVNYNFGTKTITASSQDGNGALPAPATAIPITSGWYRISFTVYDKTGLNTNLQFRIYPRTRYGISAYSYIYGAQIERGILTSFYLENASTTYAQNASFKITGSGTGVNTIGDEIRSSGVYQESISSGGSGYTTSSNNSQGGTGAGNIIISQSDVATQATYYGMRLFVNSGLGAGQYGYIASYNTTSKAMVVLKESFNPLLVTTSASGSPGYYTLSGTADVNTLYVNQPVQFLPNPFTTSVTSVSTSSVTVTNTTGGINNTLTVSSSLPLTLNMPITFTGVTFGQITTNFTYYVINIVDSTTIQVATSFGGSVWQLTTAVGSMSLNYPSQTGYLSGLTTNMAPNYIIQFQGVAVGNVVIGLNYYINDVIDSSTFTLSSSLVTCSPTTTSASITLNGTPYSNVVTVSDSTSVLKSFYPIIFTGSAIGVLTPGSKFYINTIIDATHFTVSQPSALITTSATVTRVTTNLITVASTTGFVSGAPIVFIGATFGGITAEQTYYISVVNNATTFTISTTPGGGAVLLTNATGTCIVKTFSSAFTLTSATGSLTGQSTGTKTVFTSGSGQMTGTFSTPTFGGVSAGTTYYIKTITVGSQNQFTLVTTSGGSTSPVITSATGSMLLGEVGWDNINSGTPDAALFDSTSVYYIEPRTTYTTPGFSYTTIAWPTAPSAIAYGNSMFMGISANGVSAYSSGNASTWQTIPLPYTAAYSSLAYGNNYWVAVSYGGSGNSTAIYSNSAGQSWLQSTLPSAKNWSSLAFGGGTFVAIASGASYNQITATAAPQAIALSGVITINGSGGILLGTPTTFTVTGGSTITVSGTNTGTGSITGYSNPTTYYILSTPTPTTSTFSISTSSGGSPVGSSVGNLTGLTFTYNYTTSGTGSKFTVGVKGTSYNVFLASGGTGFSIGDTVKIAGTSLGGATPANDLLITVTGVTGSIISAFTYTGTAVAGSNAASAYSTTLGSSWSAGSGLTSSIAWSAIVWGAGRFVAIATGSRNVGYSTDGQTWVVTSNALPVSSTWASIAFGKNMFVAVSSTSTNPVWSFDGITWYSSPYAFAANTIAYGQGVWVALSSGSSIGYTSEDARLWKFRSVSADNYTRLTFGYKASDSSGVFLSASSTILGENIIAGCTTQSRPVISGGVITNISIWEPGSGYVSSPTLTYTDPSNLSDAVSNHRLGYGVLASPTFINRGQNYSTTSTAITITGNGYADQLQTGLSLYVNQLTLLPSPGDNLTIANNGQIYKVTNATALYGTTAPNIQALINISPALTTANSPAHLAAVSIREKYSQVRLTNHDFLYIGYGNQIQSNYPGIPQPDGVGDPSTQLTVNSQTLEVNQGRVFYTSTDQDGNFVVGNLFGVQQATGIVTLNASQFGLTGLSQLKLGGVSVGNNAVIITSFSTEPTFLANSNQILPTQKAVKSYIASRLTQGGSNTFTGQLIAGTVSVGGPNFIASTVPAGQSGSNVKMLNKVNIAGAPGTGLPYGVDGTMMAESYFIHAANYRGNF